MGPVEERTHINSVKGPREGCELPQKFNKTFFLIFTSSNLLAIFIVLCFIVLFVYLLIDLLIYY